MRTIAALATFATLCAATSNSATAQTYGVLPPYEVLTITRSMGFDPIARPVLRGRAYVVRAVGEDDFVVRVVLDARTGHVMAVREDIALWPGPDMGPRYAPGLRYGDYVPMPPASIPPQIRRSPPQRSAVAARAPVPRARPADAAAPVTTGSITTNAGATPPPGGNPAAVPTPGHSVPAPVAGRTPPAIASAATAAAPATPAPASAAAAPAKMQLVPVAPLD